MAAPQSLLDVGTDYQYGFRDEIEYVYKAEKGLNRRVVEMISHFKGEPDWMRQFRLRALEIFLKKPMPTWGNTQLLNEIDFDDIYYYIKPAEKQGRTWDEVPEQIKNTFDKLGIPEAERKFLAGSPRSTSRKWFTTPSVKTSSGKASSSWTWTRAYANTRIWYAAGSAR
jgi:Fe-S cluster assembly protein SufB